jgi:hypothetical protein
MSPWSKVLRPQEARSSAAMACEVWRVFPISVVDGVRVIGFREIGFSRFVAAEGQDRQRKQIAGSVKYSQEFDRFRD